MDKQCYRSLALFHIADAPRRGLNLFSLCDWLVPYHGLTSLRRCGSIRFLQFLRAVLAANLDGSSADLDVNDIGVERAVTSCTSSFRHDFSPSRNSGEISRPRTLDWALSESLAISVHSKLAMQGGAFEFRGGTAVKLAECGAEVAVTGEAKIESQSGQVIVA